MKISSKNLAALVAITIAFLIFYCALLASPKSSPDVTVEGRTASVPEGSTLVLNYSSRLYFITQKDDQVTVSIYTSSKSYSLPASGDSAKIPLVGINTVDIKKTESGIEVTWPWYMIIK